MRKDITDMIKFDFAKGKKCKNVNRKQKNFYR